MFVFRRDDLPADPEFPAQLDKLGYFINDKDRIRKISDPEQEFQFKINKNPRWNEVQRAAMNACIRDIVMSRLRALGLTTLKLPLFPGPTDPHVPILVSSNLSTASRIIVVLGEPVQDLGIWAYRSVGTDGIDFGSAVRFARAVLHPDSSTATNKSPSHKTGANNHPDTALVLANTGQLIWHCGSQSAMTMQSWLALPRESAVDPPLTMTHRNTIRGNENWQAHVDCVFDEILAPGSRLVRDDVQVQVVGIADGGLGAIRYLASRWQEWHTRISSICLTNPLHFTHLELSPDIHTIIDCDSPTTPTSSVPSFASFIATRCRAYVLSQEPLGLPVPGASAHGCNCFSSGEALNVECIFPRACDAMLDWLDLTYREPGFCEDRLQLVEFDGEDRSGGGVEVGL
ncbi:hypothetical protein P170DRAFT_500300 [Aspergillus steynii IBT 23096]|uniref:Arb2 domain-containing protein n=1 Tax=Aspergillus steynii IBT 23096 TaxID=1392250 RepID=A0A2I2FYP8_9EURO|nr:uncharacterized protein P170DRAFT_500300 [Aspergillus steynii IBT 23096]PLB45748.1 hypothetical protein P170DRAFT_500300 [Aspergillus steynii IBT 23096]